MTTTTRVAAFEHAIGATGRLHLRQLSGSIRVRGVDGAIARVSDRSGRALTERFRVETGIGQLSLAAPDRSGLGLVLGLGRQASPDLEIEVPRHAEVSIESASAALSAVGLSGRTRVRTASGDVSLDGVSGTVDVVAVSGGLRVVTDAGLDLKAHTISGDVAVRASRLGRAEIATTSGNVHLDAAFSGSGPFQVDTVSGDATIVGRTGVRVEVRTVTGELTSHLPHRLDSTPGRRALVFGDGSTRLVFRSISGGLRLIAPRDALPTEVIPAPPPAGAPSPAEPAPAALPEAQPSFDVRRDREDARLSTLRALERGELTVEAAMRRLAEIEGA